MYGRMAAAADLRRRARAAMRGASQPAAPWPALHIRYLSITRSHALPWARAIFFTPSARRGSAPGPTGRSPTSSASSSSGRSGFWCATLHPPSPTQKERHIHRSTTALWPGASALFYAVSPSREARWRSTLMSFKQSWLDTSSICRSSRTGHITTLCSPQEIALYVDFKLDESYTPRSVRGSFDFDGSGSDCVIVSDGVCLRRRWRCGLATASTMFGCAPTSLFNHQSTKCLVRGARLPCPQEVRLVEVHEPSGWIYISLRQGDGRRATELACVPAVGRCDSVCGRPYWRELKGKKRAVRVCEACL